MKKGFLDFDAPTLLQKLLSHYCEKLSLKPCVAIEFEFYVSDIKPKEFFDDIASFASNRGINIHALSTEASSNQFEIALTHDFDVVKLIENYQRLKQIILDLARRYKLTVNFSAKPFGDGMHGNGMHIHLSLCDSDGCNLYCKTETDKESKLMLFSIAGLLKHMNDSLIFMNDSRTDFARDNPLLAIESSKKRYVCSSSYAPTHICWGKNNRTAAVRIPDSSNDPKNRHIEYRLAAPNADPYLVMLALLFQVKLGLKHKQNPASPIYGNAFDAQYKLKPLISNYADALNCYLGSSFREELRKFI